jgi:hypothetical protein
VNPLLFQDSLHTLDGVAFAVEQVTDAPQQIDILGPVEPAASGPFDRPDLREAGFPEAQDVLGQREILGHLADGAKGVR